MSQHTVPFNDPKLRAWLSRGRQDDELQDLLHQVSQLPRRLKWALSTHDPDSLAPADAARLALAHPERDGAGLLGIQPSIHPSHYRDVSSFFQLCHAPLQEAQDQGQLGPDAVVVFPAQIGTWLLWSHEMALIEQSASFRDALVWLLASHPVSWFKESSRPLSSSHEHELPELQELLRPCLRMKAERMAHQYQLVFSRLARLHQRTLIAGSIILPSPWVSQGKLRVGQGPLVHVCAVFQADGSLDPELLLQADAGSLFPTQAGAQPHRCLPHPSGPFVLELTETQVAIQHRAHPSLGLRVPLRGNLWDLSFAQPMTPNAPNDTDHPSP